jgi:hypothetical protein
MNSFPEKINPDRIMRASDNISQTPAFVYDEAVIIDKLLPYPMLEATAAVKYFIRLRLLP